MLAGNRVPVHVVPATGAGLAAAVRELASDPGLVTDGPGSSIEEVMRQPVPLRPATGAVIVTDAGGRVLAAHLLRPPLRDGAGHVRPQAPGVLAARVEADDRLEHFAWGMLPEIAAELGAAGGRRRGGRRGPGGLPSDPRRDWPRRRRGTPERDPRLAPPRRPEPLSVLLGIDHAVIAVDDPDAPRPRWRPTWAWPAGGGGRHEALGTFNRLVWLGDSFSS